MSSRMNARTFFEVSAHVELGGHLAAAVTIVRVFNKQKKMRGFDGFLAVEARVPDL